MGSYCSKVGFLFFLDGFCDFEAAAAAVAFSSSCMLLCGSSSSSGGS